MPFKNKEDRRKYERQHPEIYKASCKTYKLDMKLKSLAHYGKDGKIQCCWPDCEVTDPDMLTIDHVENDGAMHRKEIGKGAIGPWLVNHNYPEGFQTLCCNHQLKKELMRRRSKLE